MANFNSIPFVLSNINNGYKYEVGDGIQPETTNSIIEACSYVQSLGTNIPQTENANLIGSPNVYIETVDSGARFVIETILPSTGAEIVATNYLGKDENGDGLYEQIFDNLAIMNFTAPKGEENFGDGSMKIGQVETIDAGSKLEIQNVGSTNAPIWNFKIPRGEKGEKGEKGETYFDFSKIEWVSWKYGYSLRLPSPLSDGIYLIVFRTGTQAKGFVYVSKLFVDSSSTQYSASGYIHMSENRYITYASKTGYFRSYIRRIISSTVTEGGYVLSNEDNPISGQLGYVKIDDIPEVII